MGMTNTEFGRRVGCSYTMASRIRNGNRRPSIELLGKIARAFDIPLDELVAAMTSDPPTLSRLIRTRIFGEKDRGPKALAS